MKYYSLNRQSPEVTFDEAVIQGIAPDKGLYFPKYIPQLPKSFWDTLNARTLTENALTLLHPFVGDTMTENQLAHILEDVLSFEFPLVPINDQFAALELFHGPTLAFKDVGARFMARCLGHFLEQRQQEEEVTVLVATSGDTGGAVARGFYKVPGIKVVILYPSDKVSDIQEKQLTTLGENISALEVKGSFDDCQAMVKQAFIDTEITAHRQLTSANSINVARWLPQCLYFVAAYSKLKAQHKDLVFAIPSGNFGNSCAGMIAHKMGMPVQQFITVVNANDTVPRYMQSGTYQPLATIPTISNAMDVSDPSNFIRILALFGDDRQLLSRKLTTYSYCDQATRSAMHELYTTHGYTADPHGAIAYLGLKEYLKDKPDSYGVFLETAHPVKFLPTVEPISGKITQYPEQINSLITKQKMATSISTYEELKAFLLG